MADRRAANRLSAQSSRDAKRQRLGEEEYKRQAAEAERVRRKKKKEEAEMAQAQAELQATRSLLVSLSRVSCPRCSPGGSSL